RLVKPRISGEVLQDLILIKAEHGPEYGTAHVSGRTIPPGGTLPIGVMILIRGVPRQKVGEKVTPLAATLAVADEEGYEQKINLTLKPFNPEDVAIKP